MAFRRRFPLRGRGYRPGTLWSAGPSTTDGGEAQLSSAGTTLAPVGAASSDNVTLLRLRGNLFMRLNSIASAGDGMNGAFGICVVDADAFAVGASAMPDPWDESDNDTWLYHQFWSLYLTGTTAPSADGAQLRVDVDSRARRKTHEGHVIVAIQQVKVETGTVTLNWSFSSRVLSMISAR